MKLITALLLIIAISSSCVDKKGTPESALVNYISMRFSGKIQKRAEFSELLTGKYKKLVDALTEQQYSSFFNLSGRKLNKTSIASTENKSANQVYITYIVSYRSDSPHDKAKTDLKQIALLEKENGSWKIAEVSGIKTYHDMKEPIKID